jgi:hypothetical protein
MIFFKVKEKIYIKTIKKKKKKKIKGWLEAKLGWRPTEKNNNKRFGFWGGRTTQRRRFGRSHP